MFVRVLLIVLFCLLDCTVVFGHLINTHTHIYTHLSYRIAPALVLPLVPSCLEAQTLSPSIPKATRIEDDETFMAFYCLGTNFAEQVRQVIGDDLFDADEKEVLMDGFCKYFSNTGNVFFVRYFRFSFHDWAKPEQIVFTIGITLGDEHFFVDTFRHQNS